MTLSRIATLSFIRTGDQGALSHGALTLRTSILDDAGVRAALVAACTHWTQTTEQGLAVWDQSYQDLSIGDLFLSGSFRDRDLLAAMSAKGIDYVGFVQNDADALIPYDTVLIDRKLIEKDYLVTITKSVWDQSALDAGETDDRDTVVDETVSLSELRTYARKYDIVEPSSPTAESPTPIIFRSTHPPEDRAFFERGEHTFYELSVQAVNGVTPTADDYRFIARLIGSKFSAEKPPLPPTELNVHQLGAQLQASGADVEALAEIVVQATYDHVEAVNHDGLRRQLDFLAAVPAIHRNVQPGARIESVVANAAVSLAHEAISQGAAAQINLIAEFAGNDTARAHVANLIGDGQSIRGAAALRQPASRG